MMAGTHKTAFLGDFIFVVDRVRGVVDLRERLEGITWPKLGEWVDAPVHYLEISPTVAMAYRGDVILLNKNGVGAIGLYHLAASTGGDSTDRVRLHEKLLQKWGKGSLPISMNVAGKYCYLMWNVNQDRFVVCSDPFSTYPIRYLQNGAVFGCATDLRLLVKCGLTHGRVNPHAVYNYLNFAFVPSPATIFEGIYKLPPGSILEVTAQQVSRTIYWDPRYPEDIAGDTGDLANALRERIVQTVRRYRPPTSIPWGTFLSGGTDSSSISGILALQEPGTKVASFSIGFSEIDYDELAYARLAAQRYRLDAHIMNVGANDTLSLLPRLVRGYDEPFGNASAIPTYYCAKLARDQGIQVLLAGDGGDEIFGGNERYRKDRILNWYYNAPAAPRQLLEGVMGWLKAIDIRVFNRVTNFVCRASLPNPDRFFTDDSFAADHFVELLTPDLRAQIDVDESLDLLRDLYRQAGASAELHKLMYIDLKMAIANNDLTKVNRASKLAGVSVLYPYLDTGLVDYTGSLPAQWKVNGLSKRYLFKKALSGLLPEEIITKKKQGFGLPISVWVREHQLFRDLVHDLLLSQRTIARGYFQKNFLEHLIQRHQRGAWDHGAQIWQLMILELWHREYVDAH